MKKIFLVYPGNGVWAVESISGRGAAWRFSTQYAAVCFARQLARRAPRRAAGMWP